MIFSDIRFFVRVVEIKPRLVLHRGVDLIRHFAESVFDESFLQLRLFAVGPCAQNGFGNRYLADVGIDPFDFMRDRLSECAGLIEGARSAFKVSARISTLFELSGFSYFSQIFASIAGF